MHNKSSFSELYDTKKVKLFVIPQSFFHITEDINSYQWASNSIKFFPTIHVRSANTKFGKLHAQVQNKK